MAGVPGSHKRAAGRWIVLARSRGLAIVASTEQTKAGCREKETKSGRCRTIALPALLVEELRKHRIEQAEALSRKLRSRFPIDVGQGPGNGIEILSGKFGFMARDLRQVARA